MVTNPVMTGGSATLGVPLVQVQGYANKYLAGLTYDLSNALEVITNQDVVDARAVSGDVLGARPATHQTRWGYSAATKACRLWCD